MSEITPTIAPIEKFLACVHCGLCLSSCPTYLETGNEADSPRGRIHLLRALEDERVALDENAVHHLDLCLGCRACETACPSGVEYGALIEGGRAFIEQRYERAPRAARWRDWLARRMPEAARVPALRPLLSLAHTLRVPRFAAKSWVPLPLRRLAALVPDAPASAALSEVSEPTGTPRGTVALLAGCVARVLFPEVNRATIALLVKAGYRVVVPQAEVCCGALLAHLGREDEAHRLARRNVGVFTRAGVDFVVTNAAGCGAHLRDYGRHLAGDGAFAPAAATVAGKVRDVSQLLAAADLPEPPHEIRARVAYHDACHLAHGQGVRAEPRALLRSIPGLELVEIAESEICCGSAGTYNLTEPDMAWRLAARKTANVLAAAPDMVAAANPGCILQIRAGLRLAGHEIPVVHPIELLARAHGISS